jgi:uncharacterized integral membrane protein
VGGRGPRPAAGQQPVPRGPSTGQRIQAAFGDYAVKSQIKAILETWVLIGFGRGFTAVFLGAMGGRAAGVLGPASVPSFAVAAGPIVAGVFGLSLANKLPVETTPGAFVSAATNYAGFLLAALIAVFLAETQTGAFSTIQPGQLIVPIIVAGLLVAVTAGLVTALGRKVDYPATREEAEAQEPPAPAPQPGHAQQPQQPQ